MKTASKVMYTIGRIFNIFAIVVSIIILILGIVCIAAPDRIAGASEDLADADAAKAYGIVLVITGVILLVIYAVVCILAGHASRSLNNGRKDNAPHILMIIVGVFGDIFYLLGGIFGLVAENSEGENRAE